jgi:pyrroline-5-carboxylate reductase
LKVMQAGGIEALAEKAMNAAVNRAKELAKGG